jgi:general L-amino acid transport system ATP-binding protein
MPPIITLTDVNKWYGDFHALKDISLDVQKGEKVVAARPARANRR